MISTILWVLAGLMLVVMIVGLVKPDIAKDNKTGEVPKRYELAGGSIFLAVMFAAAAAYFEPSKAATQPSDQAAPSKPRAVAVQQIKPEQIVVFPKGAPACLSKNALEKYVTYAARGEKTKVMALFGGADGVGDCLMLPSDKRVRVISAEYNNPDIPEAGILEVVGENITASEDGAFVLVIGSGTVKVVG